jgi:opacity protein-like surface antigen
LLPLVLLLLPAPALAESAEPDYSRRGVYVGGEAIVAVEMQYEGEFREATGIDGRVDAAFGANGRIGYRLHPRIAVEAEFEWINGFDVKVEDDVKAADGEAWFASGNVKGYLLTDRRYQPFALIGLGYYRAESELSTASLSDGDLAFRVGLGFDACISEHVAFAFDIQYVRPSGNLKDLDYISIGVGLQYRF